MRKLVSAWATVAAGKVRVVVQDSGPGIPSGMEKMIFEPYVRAGGPGSRASVSVSQR